MNAVLSRLSVARDRRISRTRLAARPAGGGLGPVPWGLLEVGLAVAFAIAGIFVLHGVAGHLPKPTPVTGPLLTLALELYLLTLAVAFSIWRHRQPRAEFGYRTYGRRDRTLPILGALGMLTCLLLWQAFAVRTHIIALRGAPNLPSTAFQWPLATAVLGLAVCFVAPIAEESFFRGLIFRGLLDKPISCRLGRHAIHLYSGFWSALCLSGLLFSAAHVQWGLLAPFFAVSAIQAWMFWRSGSLCPRGLQQHRLRSHRPSAFRLACSSSISRRPRNYGDSCGAHQGFPDGPMSAAQNITAMKVHSAQVRVSPAITVGGKRMLRKIVNFHRPFVPSVEEQETGQGLAEYALILALVAVAAIVALTGLGGAIVTTLGQAVNAL